MTLFALDFKHYPLQYTTQNEMQKMAASKNKSKGWNHVSHMKITKNIKFLQKFQLLSKLIF